MKTPSRAGCPVCRRRGFRTLLDLGSWPFSGEYHRRAIGRVFMNRMVLEVCSTCSFVRKRKFSGAQRNYRKIHRATRSQAPKYLRNIFRKISKHFSKESMIVEIGSNNGAFLLKLKAMGFRKVLGIEPSPVLAKESRRSGFSVLCDFFGTNLAGKIIRQWGHADLVVCRHTIEHIPDLYSFVQAIHRLLKPGGHLFLEFPDSKTLFKDIHFYEIWDEHENYFTSFSISEMLARAGYRATNLSSRHFRDAQNLVVWAKKSVSGLPKIRRRNQIERNVLASFSSNFKSKRKELIQSIRAQSAGVIVLGAGHPQTNFVLASGIGKWVSYFVDDAPEKKGRLVAAPRWKKVISTEQFCNDPKKYLILATAFPYPDWMEKIRKRRRLFGDSWLFPFAKRN